MGCCVDVYRLHSAELDSIENEELRYRRLVELNVHEQIAMLLYEARGLGMDEYAGDWTFTGDHGGTRGHVPGTSSGWYFERLRSIYLYCKGCYTLCRRRSQNGV